MKFSNATYDKLKFIAQILLPALGTFYAVVAGIYSFDGPFESTHVVGTIVALDTLLGAILGLSKMPYDGDVNVVETDDKFVYSLALNGEPDELIPGKSQLVFKVVNEPPA